MRYRFLIAILGLVVATATAQVSPHPFRGSITTAGTDCSTATSCVVVTLPTGTASATIAIDDDTGSFSGTQQFEASVDGSKWIAMVPTANSSSTATSTTATGSWQFNPSSYIQIRVRASARASGTAGIVINWGPAVASSGGNGVNAVVTNPAANQTIQPTADVPAAEFKCFNGTNTANVVNFRNKTGTAIFTVDCSGNVNFAGSISSGTAPTACGSATGCFGGTEASTAGTPTAAQSYFRFGSTAHDIKFSLNNGAEGPLPVNSGGTGLAVFTAHDVLTGGSAGTALGHVAPGANGNVLTSNGTDWTSAAAAGGSSATYWKNAGYQGGQTTAVADHLFLSAVMIPAGGLSVGKIVFRDPTADGTNNTSACVYNSAGTLVASTTAATYGSITNNIVAFSQGTVTIPAGLVFVGFTSHGSTITITNFINAISPYPLQDTAIATTGGACPAGPITPPTINAASWSFSANEIAVGFQP